MNDPALRVLIVDAEIGALTLMRIMIERLMPHWEVQTTQKVNDVIPMLSKFKPHILITDLMMPGMDGIELVELLRGTEAFKYLYIVMWTSRGDAESVIRAFEVGVNDFLMKPIFHIDVEAKLWEIRGKILGDIPHES